jgi:AraC-like DNA-binding protein
MAWIGRPSAELADTVDFCWSAEGGPGPGTAFRELFPDAGAQLIFRLSPAGCRLALLGPSTSRITVELAGDGARYFGVRFRAGQVPRLADIASRELTDGRIDLSSLGGLRVDDLGERLARAPDPAAAQRLFEALLRGGAPLVRDERCRRAAALLEARGGALPIEALATGMGQSPRALERSLRAGLGMSPKRLARLVRLRHVLGRLRAGADPTGADLALACGYADQSHLIRDFRALTGRAPGEPEAFRTRPVAAPTTAVVHRVRP